LTFDLLTEVENNGLWSRVSTLHCMKATVKHALKSMVSELNEDNTHFSKKAKQRTLEIAKLKKRLKKREGEVASALAWQKRPWFVRAFHRWRVGGDLARRPSFFKRLERSLRKRRKAVWRGVKVAFGWKVRDEEDLSGGGDSDRSLGEKPMKSSKAGGGGGSDGGRATIKREASAGGFAPGADPASWTPPPAAPGDTSHTVANTFVLYRVIGNDLYPRHAAGQSLANVRFILENEAVLPGCEKSWVVNRIVDPEVERAVLSLLEERGQSYIHIPFDCNVYRKIPMDYDVFPANNFCYSREFESLEENNLVRAQAQLRRLKNNYVMHNNGARNIALAEGRGRARWVLPFDGNCFFTSEAWEQLVEDVARYPHLKYFAVPMARITDNAHLLEAGFSPPAKEEPQLMFRADARESFDPAHPYGRRPKVELFWRLGIPGIWGGWLNDSWDLPCPAKSPEAGCFGYAGWVARLNSGRKTLEETNLKSFKDRGLARAQSIILTLDKLEAEALGKGWDSSRLLAYSEHRIDSMSRSSGEGSELVVKLAGALVGEADEALARGPYSVTHKSTLPPSGDVHDYWHPAPYWWPDPGAADGLPYIWKDGRRVEGTVMFAEGCDKFDRSRVQGLFDDSIKLALAYRVSGRR